jgi:hypothetical protein
MNACTRWRVVAGNDGLWKFMCREAIDRYHPRPRPVPAHEDALTDGDEAGAVSLSIAHQSALDRRRAAAVAAAEAAQRQLAFRAGVVAALRESVASRGFRLSFLLVPMVRTYGVYTLRHEYIRNGVRDMWHNHDGILKVVYHRTLLLREGGSLLYAMLPGEYAAAFKDFSRTLSLAAAADDAPETAGVSVAAPLPPPPPPPAPRGGVATGSGFTQGMGAAALGPRSSQAHPGSWHLEGGVLVASVQCAYNVSLRWRCAVESAEGGLCNRLVVLSMHLIENAPAAGGGGAGGDGSTLMTQVADESFMWLPAPPLATLTGTLRGPRFL